MADLTVRQLHDRVADALKTRASKRGVSLEGEVRSTLSASVTASRNAFRRRAASLRASVTGAGRAAADSARVIRKDRDARG